MGPYLDHNHQGWAAPAQPLQRGSEGAGLREVLKKALPVLPGQGRDTSWGMEHPRDPQPHGEAWRLLWAEPLPSHGPLCPQEPGSSQGGPTLV